MPKEPGVWMIIIGILFIVSGLLWASGLLSWFGRLPGDIRIERESFRLYFPIVTMIVVSVVVSIIVHLIRRFFG